MTSTPFDLLANRMSGKAVRLSPTVELGTSGLKQSGGYVTDEILLQLQGQPGVKMFREMRDNSPIIGSIMFAIEMLARETGWRIEPHEEGDESDALFVDECLGDMSANWDETLGEILSCLTYGFQVSEIVYKRRQGEVRGKPGASSQYSDGKLGWRKWAPRSQLTIWRWQFDETGGIRGVEQYDPYFAPTTKGFVLLPIEKVLLFRPFTYLNNPQGRSILRNAYTSYHYATRIAEIEAIGIERDLAGLPVVKVPAEVMANDTEMEKWRRLVSDIKRNQQAGVVIPSDRFGMSGEGELMYELSLLSTGGERQIGTNEVLQRYETRMAQTVLADFIQLGQTPNGTRSLAETKGSMFATAMGALLDSIASVINRHAIPRLLRLNGRPTDKCPQFVFDDIEYENIAEWTEALSKLAAAGMPIFPDPAIEAVVRAKLDLPEMTEEELAERQEEADTEKERGDREREAQVAQAELAAEPEKPEVEKYDPNQPRDPGGEDGGQWIVAGGGARVSVRDELKWVANQPPDKEVMVVITPNGAQRIEGSFDSVGGDVLKDAPVGETRTIHSHPLEATPSERDMGLFARLGGQHHIVGAATEVRVKFPAPLSDDAARDLSVAWQVSSQHALHVANRDMPRGLSGADAVRFREKVWVTHLERFAQDRGFDVTVLGAGWLRKCDEEPDLDADAIVEKLAPHFSQLTLALDTVAGRIAKVEEKASETAVAMQGVCYEQEATTKRLEGIESGSMVAATASAAAAKMAGVEPLTKEAWTDVVTDALARQAPPPKGIEKGDVQEAVTAAIQPLAQAMVEQAKAIEYASRPRVKKARKLEDGSVEISES